MMKTKIVKYLDKRYKVANCAKFMATDNDGGVFWYDEQPIFNKDTGFWIPQGRNYGEAVLVPDSHMRTCANSLREI